MRLLLDSAYLPCLSTFVLSGDERLLQLVKTGMTAAAMAAKALFRGTDASSPQEFEFATILEQARHNNPELDERALQVGLIFASPSGALSGSRWKEPRIVVESVSVTDHIVDISETWADTQLEQCRRNILSHANRQPPFSPTAQDIVDDFDSSEQQATGFDWDLLHPEVQKIARKRFEAGHFADAVEASLKAIEEVLRSRYRNARGEEKSGASLMFEVFSLKTPLFLLGDLSTQTGRDMQQGYMQVFAGAMTGIRNPKAHGNVEIDAVRATHFLFLASLLMHKIDEAALVRPPKKAEKSTTDTSDDA